MILDDYKPPARASKGPGRHFSKSVYGYLSATLLRTAPKVAVFGNPHVVIENLGDEVYTVDGDGGRRERVEGVGPARCSTTVRSASRRWERAPSSATASGRSPSPSGCPGS